MIKGQEDYVTPKQGFVLKYKGTFDLKKLYNSSKQWFIEKNYILSEKEYKEKPRQMGTEFRLILEGERDIDDYVKFVISSTMFLLNTKKVNGKHHGNMNINVIAYLVLDRKKRWQSNSIKSFLFFIYNNLIIKNKIVNVYEDKLYNELINYINNMKKYIDIK